MENRRDNGSTNIIHCVLNNSKIDIVYMGFVFCFCSIKVQKFKIRFITALKVSQGNMLWLLSLRFFFLSSTWIWNMIQIMHNESVIIAHLNQYNNKQWHTMERQTIIKNESFWESCSFIYFLSLHICFDNRPIVLSFLFSIDKYSIYERECRISNALTFSSIWTFVCCFFSLSLYQTCFHLNRKSNIRHQSSSSYDIYGIEEKKKKKHRTAGELVNKMLLVIVSHVASKINAKIQKQIKTKKPHKISVGFAWWIYYVLIMINGIYTCACMHHVSPWATRT